MRLYRRSPVALQPSLTKNNAPSHRNPISGLLAVGVVATTVLCSNFFLVNQETIRKTKIEEDGDALSFLENIQSCGTGSVPSNNDSRQQQQPFQFRSAPCGINKCFFSQRDNPDIGYLVGPVHPNASSVCYGWSTNFCLNLEGSLRAYNMAMRLEQQYGIRHFLIEPPHLVTIPQPMTECMRSQIYPAKAIEKAFLKDIPEGEQWDIPPLFNLSTNVFMVQKNRVAPTPNLLFGIAPGKVENQETRVRAFLEKEFSSQSNHNKVEDGVHVHPLVGFACTVLQESKKTLPVLAKEADIFLADFQVLIDIQGHFHYIDIGRDGKTVPGQYTLAFLERRLEKTREIFLSLNQQIYNLTLSIVGEQHADLLGNMPRLQDFDCEGSADNTGQGLLAFQAGLEAFA